MSTYSVLGDMIGVVFVVRHQTFTVVPAFISVLINWKLLSTTFLQITGQRWPQRHPFFCRCV